MLVPVCDGVITQNGGLLECSGTWGAADIPAPVMAQDDFYEISGYIIGIFVIAYCVKILRGVFEDRGGRSG